MSLSRKLLGGFGSMIALILVLSVGALVAISELNTDLDRAANVTARKEYLAGEVNSAAWEMTSIEKGSVLAAVLGDKAQSDLAHQQFQGPSTRLRKALTDLREMAATGQSASLLQTLERQATSVFEADEELRHAMGNQQLDAALIIFAQKLQPRLEE